MSTQAGEHRTINGGRRCTQGTVLGLLALILSSANGCTWDRWNFLTPAAPPGPVDSLVLRGDTLEPETTAATGTTATDLAGARELYRRGEYKDASKLFHKVADNTKNPPAIAEEARYYEADSLRLVGHYPKAADTYNKMLNDFPNSAYREQALQHMFDIANFWLDDTRAEMELDREKKEGKRWMVLSAWCHIDKAKPFLDEEGRAMEKLEQVRYNDMTGPLAPKALFLAGSVKFYREDYKEADHHFQQLVDMHPNHPLAPRAVELAIISKHLSTGGSDYDGRKVAEARILVHKALENYPELAAQKQDFLQRQLVGINLQQAEKDFKMGEFYQRIGHPGSAWFYYEIVRRRYPGTKFFEMAAERMLSLRVKLEKAQTQSETAPAPSGPSAESAPAPRRVAEPQASEPAPAPRLLPNLDGR